MEVPLCKQYQPRRIDVFGLVWRHWVYYHANKLIQGYMRARKQKELDDFDKGLK